MKLIRKGKNKELADRFKKDPYGIVRMGRTWTVRLAFCNGKPRYLKKFKDDEYGISGGLSAALDDRDSKRAIFREHGLCKESRKQSTVDEKGRIRRLYLIKSKGYYTWKIFIRLPNGKVYSRTFGFYRSGKVRQAFIQAVLCFRKKEIELNGTSDIKNDMKSINGYLNAYIYTLDKNSDKFRGLRKFL